MNIILDYSPHSTLDFNGFGHSLKIRYNRPDITLWDSIQWIHYWCNTNLGPIGHLWDFKSSKHSYAVIFKNRQDAVHLKLSFPIF